MQDKTARGVTLDSLETRRLFTAVKIMPLGDSITEGWPDAQSYRYDLYNMLAQAGYSVDFVGGQTGNYNKDSVLNNLDQNNEGHSGYRADQIRDNVVSWATANKPDVVLLHAGTNDINGSQDNTGTASEISSIIDNLRSVVPNVKIVLAKIIPGVTNPTWYADLNTKIATLASSKTTAQSPITLVDQYTGFDVSADTTDGIHPNISGELKMATKWYAALQTILPTPTAPPAGTYLDGLTPTSATNGSGAFEQDRSNGGTGAIDGNTLTLNGATYMRGLGVSASSALIYDITGKGYTQFNADIGVDDEITTGGGIKFQVYADNVLKYDSGTMTATTATKSISVDITGSSALKLVVTDAGGGSATVDHGDWGNARVVSAGVAAPAAPSGLAATVSGSNIALNWTDNSSNETNFRIERKAAGGSYATLIDVPANQTSYTDLNATPGTAYTYHVFAYNSAGSSGYSNESTATVPVITGSAYLSDLSYVVAANGWGPVEKDKSNGESGAGDGNTLTLNGTTYAKGLGVHADSDISLSLGGKYASFSTAVGVDDEVGSNGSVDFQIYVDGVKQFDSGTMTGNSTTQTANVSLTGAQTLRLLVKAVGGYDFAHGDWANAYLTAGSTTVTVPTAPSNPTAAVNSANTAVTIGWTDNSTNETGFVVQRMVGTSGTWTTLITTAANVTSYSDTTVARGTTYAYRVAATNSAGTSAYVTAASVTVPALNPPAAPSGLAGTTDASTGSPRVVLGWTDNATNETAYRIERKTGSGSYAAVTTGGANLVSFTDATVAGSTTYTYRVIASNADGDSAASNEFTITTAAAATAPAGASNVTAGYDTTSGKVTLNWTDNSSNETGFRIERRTVLGGTPTIVGTAAANAVTFTDPGPLAASTTYYYRVIAFNSAGDGPSLVEPSVTTPTGTTGSTVYLSDLGYAVNDNGWGYPEKDRSNGENGPNDGNVITLNGKTYTKGLGVHAHSDISYNLAGKYTAFTADIGVDDEVGNNGSVVFQVYLDGTKVYDSGTMTGATATKSISVDTTGKQTLQLIVTDSGDGNNSDHADWANAQLSTAAVVPVPAAASGVAATINNAANGFNVAWTDNSTTETGFRIERKTDSGAYASVGSVAANVTSFADGSFVETGHTYTYRVIAFNGSGDGAASNESAVTVPTLAVPATPNGLTATYDATTKSVSISWSDNSFNESGFRVERAGSTGGWTAVATVGADVKTATDSGPFTAATSYSYRVIATNSVGDSGPSITYGITTPSNSVFVSDLTPVSSTNGWGPIEKDMSNGESGAGDGHTLSIRGKTYAKGIGTHGYSKIVYNLAGAYSLFTSDLGIDDETGGNGTVIYDVYVDGVLKYATGVVTGKDAVKTASVSVAGAQQLWLVVENSNDGADFDHADWANAQLSA